MQHRGFEQGISLVELMIALAIISIVAAISIPAYQDYIATARTSVMSDNIQTIRVMQADRRSNLGEYAEGVYDVSGSDTSLTTNLGWAPRTEADVIDYVVACATDGGVAGECARTSGYTVTATHPDDASNPLVRIFNVSNDCTNC